MTNSVNGAVLTQAGLCWTPMGAFDANDSGWHLLAGVIDWYNFKIQMEFKLENGGLNEVFKSTLQGSRQSEAPQVLCRSHMGCGSRHRVA